MKKADRRFIPLMIGLASALFASALMFKFSPNSSWLAFCRMDDLLRRATAALVQDHTIGSEKLLRIVAPLGKR